MRFLFFHFEKQCNLFWLSAIVLSFVSCSGNQETKKADFSNADSLNVVQNKDSVTKSEENKNPSSENRQRLVITTNLGKITLELYNETPRHRDNFIKLVKQGFYNKTLFHRVIKDFMIQGGDPDSKNADKNTMLGKGGPGYTIPAEFSSKYFHKKGALAAARQGDEVNPEKASSGSQFYIVHGKKYSHNELENMSIQSGISFSSEQIKMYETIGGTPFLDGNYTVFGEVVDGLDVVDKIAEVKTSPGNRPNEDIFMDIKIVEVK